MWEGLRPWGLTLPWEGVLLLCWARCVSSLLICVTTRLARCVSSWDMADFYGASASQSHLSADPLTVSPAESSVLRAE